MENYISKIRKKLGHDCIILNYAGCLIFDRDGKVLLQKRADCNMWGFPGGMVELGESVEEAAVREIKEETGLDVEVTSLYGIYSKYFDSCANGDKFQSVCVMFKAKIIGGALNSNNIETLDLKYFSLDNMPKLFNQQHRDLLDDLLSGREYVYR